VGGMFCVSVQMRSIGSAVKVLLEHVKTPQRIGGLCHVQGNSSGGSISSYMNRIRDLGVRDVESNVADCQQLDWNKLSPHSQSLVSFAAYTVNESDSTCVSVRLDANGKHVVVIPSHSSVMDECVSWILRGAQVTVLCDGEAIEVPQAGERIRVFDLASLSKSDVKLLINSADIVVEAPKAFSHANIPELLQTFRLIRPKVEVKKQFDIDYLSGIDLLNFHDAKTAKSVEGTLHEFLELCWSLKNEKLAARPLDIILNPKLPLPDHVVSHACFAALNPFHREAENRIVLNQSVDNPHDSVNRFVRFAESRLAFRRADSLDDRESLKVISDRVSKSGVVSADSDPIRIASQHLMCSGALLEFKQYEFERVKCRKLVDTSTI
jgi:hypothetical protein